MKFSRMAPSLFGQCLSRFVRLSSCVALVFCFSAQVFAATYDDVDPYEGFNRAMFSFNEQFDKYLLKPTAQAYDYVTPSIVNEGVTNFFSNLGDVDTFVNSVLQGKFHNAMVSLNRVIYNTIFGIGGFFDIATHFGLKNDKEDFGQTLAAWGYEESNYLVLPFFGPSTFRDFVGRVVDHQVDPLMYVDDLESTDRYALTILNIVDLRADLLAAENLLLDEDKYLFVRNAYFGNREFLINDGIVSDPFADEDFEYLEDF